MHGAEIRFQPDRLTLITDNQTVRCRVVSRRDVGLRIIRIDAADSDTTQPATADGAITDGMLRAHKVSLSGMRVRRVILGALESAAVLQL